MQGFLSPLWLHKAFVPFLPFHSPLSPLSPWEVELAKLQFFNNQSVFSKSNLPTSRLARKRLAAKGFGAGGVAPTRPVNLPCRPSSVHPKSVIRNRIAHCRDGLHCPSASGKLPLETTHPKSVIRNRITHSRDGLHCPSASRKLPLETTHS